MVPTTYDGVIRDQGGAVFNVKSSAYGAVGDGSTDDTNAIQSAINAAATSGGVVMFPTGTYKVSSTLALTANSVVLRGVGTGSILKTSSATADIVSIGTTSSQVNYCGVYSLAFDSSAIRTAGYAINVINGFSLTIEDTFMANQFNGLGLTFGGGEIFVNRGLWVSWASASGTGLYIDITSPEVGNYWFDNLDINCNSAFSGNHALNAGVNLNCLLNSSGLGGGVYMSNCCVEGAQYGLLIGPTNHYGVENVWFHGCVFDSCTLVGIEINQGTSSAPVKTLFFDNCWASSTKAGSNGNGVQIDATSGTPNNVHFRGLSCIDNANDALHINGCTDFSVTASYVSYNGKTGIWIAAGVSGFQLNDNKVLSNGGWGILVNSGSSNNYMVVGNHTYNNASGNLTDSGTGANKQVTANLH